MRDIAMCQGPFAIIASRMHWTEGGRDSLLYVDDYMASTSGTVTPCLTFDQFYASRDGWAALAARNLAAAYRPEVP